MTRGLAAALPPLAASLDRGPTPAGPSFAPARTPLVVAKVTAGSNPEAAARTIDDDETTVWTSDGKLTNAWVEYELTGAANVSEVSLKLTSWRTRSYPVRVTVDGREVYRGVTPPSLGYVTLAFPPTRGKVVRVQLTGAPRSSDALALTEVTGQKSNDGDLPAPDAKGALGIVEAELYGPGQ